MADDTDDASNEIITSSDVRTVLGGARRDQRWGLTELVEVQTILGRTRFDLRDARPLNPDDDVEMSINCVLGTVELLVPFGTRVRLDGTTYLGGSSSDVTESAPDADDHGWTPSTTIPPLDITATVVLGRVRVHTPDRPASNTWFSRLMDRRRSRTSAKKTKATVVATSAPALGPTVASVPAVSSTEVPAGTGPEPVVPPAVGVDAAPPRVAAAVDVAAAPIPAVGRAANVEPAPETAAALGVASPAAPGTAVDDDVPRFEPSEPDEDALGDTDDWKAQAEAEAARGGWSLSLGDDDADSEAGD